MSLLSRLFSSRTRPRPADVVWDVHSHLLPGVDDGVRSEAEALEAVKLLASLGYGGAVLTPHIRAGVFDNDEADLRDRFAQLTDAVAGVLPGFGLQLGAEYRFDEALVERVYAKDPSLLRFGMAERLLLVELPNYGHPPRVDELIGEASRQGGAVVLAHVERCAIGPERAAAWRQGGALCQVNVGSLAGQHGSEARRAARQLLRRGEVDLLGSDLHRPRQGAHLKRGWSRTGAGRFDADAQRRLLATRGAGLVSQA